MRWQLHDGTRETELIGEPEIIEALRKYELGSHVLIRRDGAVEWAPLRSHAPFAMAFDAGRASAAQAAEAPLPPLPIAKPIWRRASVQVGAAWGLFALVALVGYCTRTADLPESQMVMPKPQAEPHPAVPVPPKPSENESFAKKLFAASTLTEAARYAKPIMTDTTGDVSPGAAALTIWGVEKGKWADVETKKDETTFGLIMKDPDAERGKRYCASGSIIQIEAEKLGDHKVTSGLLMDGSMNIFRFDAWGSSGSLVAHSSARICGVIVGRYDYSNSGGGIGHAVSIVGMFDLPENKPKKGGR